MLNQLRLYKNRTHFANVPQAAIMQGVTQVPWAVIKAMYHFASGHTAETRMGIWSWEWQRLP